MSINTQINSEKKNKFINLIFFERVQLVEKIIIVFQMMEKLALTGYYNLDFRVFDAR